jgi:hypothetical protein
MLEHIPPIVTNEENLDLTRPIYESKIFDAIWCFESDKSGAHMVSRFLSIAIYGL